MGQSKYILGKVKHQIKDQTHKIIIKNIGTKKNIVTPTPKCISYYY